MNIKRKDKIYIGVSSVVVLAMAAAIGFLVAAKDGWDASITLIKWLQDQAGIPQTTAITILMGILLIGVLAILILLGKSIWKKDNRSFTEAEEKRARELYLMWIRKDVDNRFTSSIHNATYINLKLKESYKLISARNYTHHNNSDGTNSMIGSIAPLIDKKPFALLLLGAPGAGKTTTLLNCVSQSVTEAEANENNNIPVFINLSKWGRKEGLTRLLPIAGGNNTGEEHIVASELDEWLIRIVSRIRRTGLTKDIVKYWLEEKQKITLFLDGLDEADEAVRSTIVDKINSFVNKYSAVSVLITSRLADYEALVNTSKVKLDLDGAVTIHPLTPEQINDYLKSANAQELQDLFKHDEALREMASSPLELSIMVLAWKGAGFRKLSSLKTNSITTKRIALFDVYVKAMVKREQLKRKRTSFSHESDLDKIEEVSEERVSAIYKNLGWIARLLCRNSQSTYSPGRLFDHLTEFKGEADYKYDPYDRIYRVGESILLSKQYVDVVNKVILFFALGIVTLCYVKVYPVLILFLAIPVSLLNYVLDFSRLDSVNNKLRINRWYLVVWLVIAIAVPFLYWPVGYLISIWSPLIWILSISAGIISLIFLYEIEELDSGSMTRIFSNLPIWKHAVFFVVSSVPFLFLQFNTGNSWHQWFIIGVVAFLVSIYYYAYESVKIGKILLYNLYAISAAVAGILILQPQATLNTILCIELLMILLTQASLIRLNAYRNSNKFSYSGITVFFAVFLGMFAGLFVSAVKMIFIIIILIVVLSFLGRFTFGEQLYEKVFSWLATQIIHALLKLQKTIPFNYRKFLIYSCRALLLKKSNNEYEFIHRRIRDHFAIWEYMPLLEKDSGEGRVYAIKTFSSLKDASCDVLLEMIDDHDKGVRTGCLIGLGEIGSALAVKSLIEAVNKTSGELQQLAIKQIYKVRDIAAIPDLLRILNNSPVNSLIFNAALTALTDNLDRLFAWDNDEKMNEYITNIPDGKYVDQVKTILCNKQEVKKKAEMDWVIKECISPKASRLTHLYSLHKAFCRLTNEDLLICVQYYNSQVVRTALKLLFKRGQVKTAVESILRKVNSEEQRSANIIFSKAEIRQMAPYFINIINSNDELYLKRTLTFLQNYSVPKTEDAILQAAQHYDSDLKLESIKSLKKNATNKSFPFLLQSLLNNECRQAALEVLSSFKLSTLKALHKNERNDDIRYQLILIIIERAKFWQGTFLIQLLQQNNPEVKNAVIYKLGDFKIVKAIPALIKAFNEKNERTLLALIDTLGKLGEKSIIPALPDLFMQYNWLQRTIIKTLVKLKADKEIVDLYQISKKGGVDLYAYYDSLRYLFANYFASTGKQKMSVETIFPLTTLPNDSLRISSDDIDESKSETGRVRRKIYKVLKINEPVQGLLEIIYEYDAALAREIAMDIINDPSKDYKTVLINKLLPATEPVNKMLLITIADSLHLKDYDVIKRLRSFLDEPEDDNITVLAIKALGKLGDDYSLNRFLFYLTSQKIEIVQAALESVEMLRKNNSITIDNLPDLIKQSNHLQLLLTDPRYVPILNLLNMSELQKLATQENPGLRYLSAIYSGNLGHGKLIGLLNNLLEDQAAINIANDHGHTTVSSGALYALHRIGSPTAKSFIEGWQKKNIV